MTTATRDIVAESRERFASDTAEHELTVLRDDGLYRHLRFHKPGTGIYGYNLITWPGYLVIAGDCGDYTFSRIDDMFEFFEGSGEEINPHYWSEKLCGPRRGRDLARSYSYDVYERAVREWLDQKIADMSDDREINELRAAVREQLLDEWLGVRDSEGAAHRALRDFEHDGLQIYDTFEWDLREYDWTFLWCCWAIVRGVARYREKKAAESATTTFRVRLADEPNAALLYLHENGPSLATHIASVVADGRTGGGDLGLLRELGLAAADYTQGTPPLWGLTAEGERLVAAAVRNGSPTDTGGDRG